MNIYEHISDLSEMSERVKNNQDKILDIFVKDNNEHISLLNETVELMNDIERLEQDYRKLLENVQ
jgi:hypothetical protein